jgi:ribonucleoside-triphosphate reductase
MTRIARLEGVKARVAPILYMEGLRRALKADDDVSEIFKNGRASISLGYIGIHETINALSGNQHMYDSEALREKGVAIVQRLRDAVDRGKKRPATALACTARRAKTCATASAVWTPPSSASLKA